MEAEPIVLANESYTERKESEELKSDSQVSSLDNWVESKTFDFLGCYFFFHNNNLNGSTVSIA